MTILKCRLWTTVLLFVCCVLTGCGKKGAQTDVQSFDQAPPEIKAAWETAVAADKTNDYYTASTSYAQVMSAESKLTPKQLELLKSASLDLSQRMVAAANNGDDTAKQALVKLMKKQDRR